jgi:hypothetical protein
MILADGGVPVEDLSQGYPDADSDTVLGEKFRVIASGRPSSFGLSAATYANFSSGACIARREIKGRVWF